MAVGRMVNYKENQRDRARDRERKSDLDILTGVPAGPEGILEC